MRTYLQMNIHSRRPQAPEETPLVQPVVLPLQGDLDPCRLAWAEARFALELLTEHSLFFIFLMPHLAEVPFAYCTRLRALHHMFEKQGYPEPKTLNKFVETTLSVLSRPLYERARTEKGELGLTKDATAWQALANYVEHDITRWMKILMKLGTGKHAYEHTEIVSFWSETMLHHEQLILHLMKDQLLTDLTKGLQEVHIFQELASYIPELKTHPAMNPQIVWRAEEPSLEEVVEITRLMLSIEEGVNRAVEAIWLRNVLDHYVADHLRREAIKFIDEIDRA